jgi:signal transduction histidine kinase
MAHLRALAVDAAVGLGLCAVLLGRVVLGSPLDALTWWEIAVAALAVTSLVARRRLPLPALACAVACGIVAMPVNLESSAVDGVVGGALLAMTVVRVGRELGEDRTRGRIARLREGAGAAWWRGPAVTVAAVGGVLVTPVDLKESAGIAVLLAAYAVGLTTGRRAVVAAGASAASALAVGGTLASPQAWTGPNTPVPLIAVALVGVAVGDAVRSRRALVVASEDRARRREHALEEEARRRLVEERLSIAREVHDLVAHHIAVITMQAGVAAHHLRNRPDEAAEALGHVRSAGRTVVGELGQLLSVLRDVDDPTGPVGPTPRLADLDRLLDSFTAAGLRVAPEISGAPRSLPPTTELAAYRVVQECLTNAHKHGDGTAVLRMAYAPDRLDICVRNPGPALPRHSAAPGPGHGIAGMRERLSAVGGTLTAGAGGGRGAGRPPPPPPPRGRPARGGARAEV